MLVKPQENRLIDATFENKYAINYRLLVDVHQGFDCLLVDNSNQALKGFVHNDCDESTLQNALNNEDLLKQLFHNTYISLKNIPFCLVPNAFFNEEKMSELIAPITDIPKDYTITHHSLVNIGAHAIFAYPNYFDKTFRFLSNKKILAFSAVLADFAAYQYKSSKETQVIVNIEKDFFTLAIHAEKGLQLCNDFTYQTNEDFAYYLLFALEQNSINTGNLTLKCIGNIDNTSLFEMLKEFIPKISFFDLKQTPFTKVEKMATLNSSLLFSKTLPLLCAL